MSLLIEKSTSLDQVLLRSNNGYIIAKINNQKLIAAAARGNINDVTVLWLSREDERLLNENLRLGRLRARACALLVASVFPPRPLGAKRQREMPWSRDMWGVARNAWQFFQFDGDRAMSGLTLRFLGLVSLTDRDLEINAEIEAQEAAAARNRRPAAEIAAEEEAARQKASAEFADAEAERVRARAARDQAVIDDAARLAAEHIALWKEWKSRVVVEAGQEEEEAAERHRPFVPDRDDEEEEEEEE